MSESKITITPAKTVASRYYSDKEVLAILEAHMLAAAGIPSDTKRAESSAPSAAPTSRCSVAVTLEGEWPKPRHSGAERAVLRHLRRGADK